MRTRAKDRFTVSMEDLEEAHEEYALEELLSPLVPDDLDVLGARALMAVSYLATGIEWQLPETPSPEQLLTLCAALVEIEELVGRVVEVLWDDPEPAEPIALRVLS